jgi:hypothetical protein
VSGRRRRSGGWVDGRTVVAGAVLALVAALFTTNAITAGPAGGGRTRVAAPVRGPMFGDHPAAYGWAAGGDLVPYAYRGVSCGQVARLAAPLFTAAFDRVVPRMSEPLTSCGCYNYRLIRGGDTLSYHAYGLACDVNPRTNPSIPGGWAPHTIPDNAGELVRPYGIVWGGDWTNPRDYMHFEVHVPRAAACRNTC